MHCAMSVTIMLVDCWRPQSSQSYSSLGASLKRLDSDRVLAAIFASALLDDPRYGDIFAKR